MLEQLACSIRDSWNIGFQRVSRFLSPRRIVVKRPPLWNNLNDRVNQPETKFHLGSSETTRKASWFSYLKFSILNLFMQSSSSSYDFSNYLEVAPDHKMILSFEFLEWFVGFSEGDGSFTTHSGRPIFVLNQADLAVLQKIRTELGFGRVEVFKQEGRLYGRYLVTKKDGIERLIHLFNGNIHLVKVHKRFENWVKRYNRSAKTQFMVKPCRFISSLTLNSSWVSGFFDAEGGFSASLRVSPRYKCGYRLTLKGYIDQKGEYALMERLAELFEIPCVTCRNTKKDYFRIESGSKKVVANFLTYFHQYPLKSRKHRAFAVWKRLAQAWLNDIAYADVDLLKNRVQNLQFLNARFKELKSVLLLLEEMETDPLEPHDFMA